MASGESQRRCPWCVEVLRAEARVCPHCARWQGPIAACVYHLLYRPFAACAFVLCIVGFQFWIISLALQPLASLPAVVLGTSEAAVEGMDVAAAEMTPGEMEGEPVLAIVGRLRNNGEDARRIVALEAQFTDADGRLIDVRRLRSWYTWSVTVPPHGEAAFRLVVSPELPAERYASQQVFVRATAPPNPFL